jgi:hypothetical protein
VAGRIVVEIERDGEVVPVTKVVESDKAHETGVELLGESSASPRGLGIDLRPLSAGTKVEFSRVQERHGWVSPRTFKLRISRDNDRLILVGVDDGSLPQGTYELKVRVGGIKVKPSFPRVDVPKNGDVKLRLREQIVRRLELTVPVAEFDERPRRIVTHPDSKLDGMSAADWLTGAKHRDGRKAVLLNVLAKLAAIRKLGEQVQYVFFAEIDRIYCGVSPELVHAARDNLKRDADSTIDPTHRRLLDRLPEGICPERYKLESYRERVRRGSLQAVIALPKDGASGPCFADFDIDGANPGQDLVTFFIHFGEVLDPDKTDHLRLLKRLDHAQVGDFLYYRVTS